MKSLNLNQPDFSESLMKSIIYYLDDGFLSTGTVNTSGTLSRISHPEYTAGQVYGSSKKNWSWDYEPQVYVNSALVTSGYTVNYKDGLIIFNSVQPSSVFARYTYKQVLVLDAEEIPFFRGDSKSFDVYTGTYRPEAVQLPVLALELGGSKSEPFELGNYSRDVNQQVLINVIAATKADCAKLADLLYQQVDANVNLFDYKQAFRSGLVPLNDDGELVNQSGTYTNLHSTYPFTPSVDHMAHIEDSEKENIRKISNNLYHCTVRYDVSSVLKMSV